MDLVMPWGLKPDRHEDEASAKVAAEISTGDVLGHDRGITMELDSEERVGQGDDQADNDDSDTEYDYDAAVEEEKAARNMDADLGDDDDDHMAKCKGEEEYEYPYSDSDESPEMSPGKHLAEADAAVIEPSDGVAAKVEVPSPHIIRLWVSVLPWRLYEGLGPRVVEALGLDPTKGVQVMLTGDQHYTKSTLIPKVKWVRQVAPDGATGEMSTDESCGASFLLQWMLRKRIEEALFQNWPPTPGGKYGMNLEVSSLADLGREGNGEDDVGFSMLAEAAWIAAEGAANDPDMLAKVQGGVGAMAGSDFDGDSPAARKSIQAISECTGVSEELAQYALRQAKCVQQAQLNLLEEGTRECLEVALREDRIASISELNYTFPGVDKAIIEQAVLTNPGSLERQRLYVRRVEAGELPRPPPTTPDCSQPQQQETASGRRRLFPWQRWTSKSNSPSVEAQSGKGQQCATPGAGVDMGVGMVRGARLQGGLMEGEGGNRNANGGYQYIDLTGDEEREDRRARLEHLAGNNLLLRIALLVIDKLRNANKYCVVCDEPIEGYLPAVPIVCSKDLCVMSSEDMGCGTDVESQIEKKGDTVDLLVDFFVMAMYGSRPEIGFPNTIQWEGQAAFKHGYNQTENDLAKVQNLLALIPSVTEMQECIRRKRGGRAEKDDDGLRDDINTRVQSLREALTERDPLAYVLLRWLLSANRAHVRPLSEEELIKEIPCEKQFVLVTGTAEREAKFQKMKREAAVEGRGTGSFFAFHGSKAENWHGILREGLKNMSGTKYMSAGASFGKGIYMAEKLHVALSYASRGSACHWMNARTTGSAVVVAVCEVVNRNRSEWARGPQYFVVPDEECVATRFLLINPKVSSLNLNGVSASDINLNMSSLT